MDWDLDRQILVVCSVGNGVSWISLLCGSSSSGISTGPSRPPMVALNLDISVVGIVGPNRAVPLAEYLLWPRRGRSSGMQGRVTARVGSRPLKMKGMGVE